MAVRVKIVAVFGEIFWGGIWRVLALKVAVSNFDLLETLGNLVTILLRFCKFIFQKKVV